MKLNFSEANKKAKKAFRTQQKKLVGVKSSTPGVTAIVDVVYCPQKTKTTPGGNVVKEILVRVIGFKTFPASMARWDPENSGALLVKRRELLDAAAKTYGWSGDEVSLKPGDEISLSFIGVTGAPIPDCLMSDNASELTLQISSLVPKYYTNKNGVTSVDSRTGEPRVFWDCGKSVIPQDGYENQQKVVRDLQNHLPLWKCAFPSERPTRTKKMPDGSFVDTASSARRAICFGGDTKTEVSEDGTELFVHNAGVVSTDQAEYTAGQNDAYKNLGIMASIYSLYDERKWNPRTESTDERRLYQNTIVRLHTRDDVVTRAFGIMDPQRWKALAPHLVRALIGVVFVNDPFDKKQELINNIQDFVESNELVDGGNEDAAAVIAAGNGVQRGTVATIDRIVLDMPGMIRQVGTEIPLEQALRITENFKDAKVDANAHFNVLPQNQATNPYKLNVLCLSNFRKAIDADTLKSYKIYLVTTSKKWNNGSGKTAEQVIAEYEANDDVDRDAEDRTFEPHLCAFYAVHDKTSDDVQSALDAMATVADMDLAPAEVKPAEDDEHRKSVRASPEPEDAVEKASKASKKARDKKKKDKRKKATAGFDDDDEDEE
ncbi:MAG: hypothetical protein CMP20_01555 [Rickettsiales bacterium]|nr:hypothetical protein [Rickettsiales bacterium]